MSNQISFFAELRESIHAGAALAALSLAAGCGGDATAVDVASAGTGNVTTPQTDDVDIPVAINPVDPPLEPFALDRLGCFGPSHDGGYYGQCCFDARCYTPPNGERCATADEVSASRSLIALPPGSGECGCGIQDEGRPYISGPFAPNLASANDAGSVGSTGSCCYVVGSISCTGRPLIVDGAQLVAPAVQRNDWLEA